MSDIQEEIKKAHRKALEQDFNEIIKELKQEEHKNLELSMRINKAVGIIKKYGYEKQMEEDYLMNRVNLANYNCLLLDILKGDNK